MDLNQLLRRLLFFSVQALKRVVLMVNLGEGALASAT